MRILSLVLAFTVTQAVAAAPAPGDGAFTTLMVQAKNTGAYVAALTANDSAFKATGTDAAGYCITRSGHDYPGQMMVWSGFANVAGAMGSIGSYDPFDAPAEFFFPASNV